MPEGLSGAEGSRPRVTARWMMACFCSLSSAITFRFARIARCSRPFAQSRNRAIAACSSGGGNGTGKFAYLSAPIFWIVAVLKVESFQAENALLWVNAKRNSENTRLQLGRARIREPAWHRLE